MISNNSKNKAKMQLIEAEKIDNKGVTAFIKEMEISNTVALEVDEKEVGYARVVVTRMHKETLRRFTTKKSEKGIRIWRLEDAEPAETKKLA